MAIDALPVVFIHSITRLREGYPATWRDTKGAQFVCAMKNLRDNW